MIEISGKSLHEIYKEDDRKYKESIKLTDNFDKTESLTVTMPMEEFDKLEKLALSAHTDSLSVEKLIEKEIKGYEVSYKISGRRSENYIAGILEGLKIARAYVIDSLRTDEKTAEKLQEQLNSKVKALTEIRANIEEHNQIYDLSTDTALLLEGIDGIAFEALAAIGGDDD